MSKIGRNERCPCGSGKKYKHCHGSFHASHASNPAIVGLEDAVRDALRPQTAAARLLREQQQGRGRPIISTKVGDTRVVVAGKTVYQSSKWITFADFLMTFLKEKLGRDWGAAEMEKPAELRHPFFEWAVAFETQMKKHNEPGEVISQPLMGAGACYLGLAYNLYLLEHNVELQERYLDRLRNPGNFQGAYYELIVAGILIESGFELVLEDETDNLVKHCEFAAVSKTTGRKYWVEAKMRSVQGVLGKSAADGVPRLIRDPTTRLTGHLADALAKPAADERLIFIDINAPIIPDEDPTFPKWAENAIRRLESKEKTSPATDKAYVFVTDIAFHLDLHGPASGKAALAIGFGIDFGKPAYRSLIEAYKHKQAHIDAHEIGAAFSRYPNLPSTFDGSLPSDVYGAPNRNVQIGETYFFEGINGTGVVATVTSAVVIADEKAAMIAVSTNDGQHLMLKYPLNDDQLADYKRHPDVFFGQISTNGNGLKKPLELFEWLLKTYRKSPKEVLLSLMKDHADVSQLAHLDQQELALIYCERASISILQMSAPELLRPRKQSISGELDQRSGR